MYKSESIKRGPGLAKLVIDFVAKRKKVHDTIIMVFDTYLVIFSKCQRARDEIKYYCQAYITKNTMKLTLLSTFLNYLWKATYTLILDTHDPKEYRWNFGNLYEAQTTDNMVAPSSLTQLVSYNSSNNWQTKGRFFQKTMPNVQVFWQMWKYQPI